MNTFFNFSKSMASNKDTLNPIEQGLISPQSEEAPDEGKVRMKKELGLLEGVAVILGIIFGSGNILLCLQHI